MIRFNPLSPAFAKDPYAVYETLRAMDRPYYFAEQEMWLLASYDDISKIALHPSSVRSLKGIASEQALAEQQRRANWHDMPYHERFVQCSLLDSDGQVHRRLRSLVFKLFTNKAIAHVESVSHAHVHKLLTALKDRPQIDFVHDFAAHIPGHVIGHLLGVPAQDCDQLRIWSEQIVKFFDVDRSDQLKVIAEIATQEFYEYLTAIKQERTKRPQNDVISNLIASQARGQLSDDEFISTCMLILMAGHGSTIDVLCSGMHLFLQHPEVVDKLRKDYALLPSAIEEVFRYEPPLPFFHRHITQEITLNGQSYSPGTTFGLLYASANRDETQFSRPEVFDIERQPNRHLAFGRGVHLCLGNHLAKMNMRIALHAILTNFIKLEQADNEVEYKRGLSARGPQSLKMNWKFNP